ncbi:hypothetical protein [Ureibacillus thermosphaericus]|uniref:hypothetical protein n=1 Tax=Ureibacillus thermosphaericus TaxID=51173 RepID=UPI0030C9A03B
MLNTLTLPSTVATDEEIAVPSCLVGVVSIEIQDEQKLYSDLSRKLLKLETSLDYSLDEVNEIKEEAEQILIAIDEKQELLMRCDWLITMWDVKNGINHFTSQEEVNAAYKKLIRVQTCPLKKELMNRLDALQKTFEKEETAFSPKELLLEKVFETGNKIFINLGTTGREAIIEEVLKGDGKVETAIAKAEELEASVEALRQYKTTKELKTALEKLPLKHYGNIPEEYEAEILQKLLAHPNWNGLFHLDCLILQYTIQVKQLHEPKQEEIQATLVVNEKLVEQLKLQQV